MRERLGMENNLPENIGIGAYELQAWIAALGSVPQERIAYANESASYEMDVIHVFKLENKKYAVVTERGCSCYSSSDADIELFPTKKTAMESFDKWVQSHKRDEHDSGY